eukprot:TRINITY_DN2850_c0_g2_i1.p1 TRINITY_DN2850_c0_g2~~TRINITY_DN2850_c0_g2_i1.p1  ORF type:complete len:341 (+),score=76.25 TRINITY_DN2850_c0_g2_i1:2-1024(+)
MSCAKCGATFGMFTWKYQCEQCQRFFCSACRLKALLPEGRHGEDSVLSVCVECFKRGTSLDLTVDHEEMGDITNERVLLFVHGGGSNRKMWLPHMEKLKHLARCISIDLPGHGSLMDQPISLENACQKVVSFTKEHLSGKRVILVGHSLGGYLAMHLLGENSELFDGAVICASGQNVGPGRSFMASFGLFMMGSVGMVSEKSLVKTMLKQAPQGISQEMIEVTMLRSGYFFECSKEMVEILKTINPCSTLPNYNNPILFLNGSKDHHDSDEKFLSVCKSGELKVYEGGDHFFTHDPAFFDTFIDDLTKFATRIFDEKEGKEEKEEKEEKEGEKEKDEKET